ncbi:metalloprotease [Entomophthora muscae]|uniref:Metalloprotease n=1 Tax=Entomophthora muscae TaxID=34485 RepID=A0ACC2T738_9FUNG|nr:metalloprotease [Entomophthora muscae]
MLLWIIFPILAAGDQFSNQIYNYVPYRQYDELIQKSSQDNREYLGLELNNKLQVLLVSDPKAIKGGVALSVASGANDDPDEIPGMAHFCEHLILMGSKKYPSPTEFKDFLAATGGERNAGTTRDYTVYFFDVEHWALDGAMDLFSQFFVAPKFDEAEVLREATAVDFEYQRANGWSSFAFDQAVFAGLNSTHKAARFFIGTYNTLITEPDKMGMDIREKVVSHYTKHYSSNIMHLVVSGKEDIETLKEMVIPRFSHIPNRNLVPTNVGSPFNNLGTNVIVDPEKDKNEITIAFVINPIPYSRYQTTLKFLR